MKVLHVIGSLDPDMGGLPRAVAGLAGAQARQGLEVVLLFCGEPPAEDRLRRWMPEAVEQVRMISLPSIWTLGRSSQVESVLEAQRPDWIQTHGLWEPILHASMRWARRHAVPYGVTPHSMMHPWQQRHCRWRKALLRNLLGVEALWRQASLVQALTEAEADPWRSMCGDAVRVIPNGVSLCPQEPGSRKRSSAPYLLFLSRLHAQKAPEALLQAFVILSNQIADVELVFAGPDYGEKRRLQGLVHQAGLEARVHFAGSLEGQDKWDALRRCALFCLPSRAEGLSLAVLEACAAGAPCLISEECGFPELVDAGGALLVDRNPAALASRMLRVLEHPEEAEEMGRRARQLVENAYAWEQVADRFHSVLREVIG